MADESYENYDEAYDYLTDDITTTADSSEWTNHTGINATTLAPDKKILAKELEDKLYHLKLWTILLISCIGLILFLASLWIGRKTLSRVQRLGIMKPSRMRDIWENVQIINFRPAVLFKKSNNDVSKKHRNNKEDDNPIIHSAEGSRDDLARSESVKQYSSPGPVFTDAPVDKAHRAREEFRRQRSRSVRQDRYSHPFEPSHLNPDVENGQRKRSSSESSTRRMRFSPHYDDEEEQIVYKIVAV